MKLAAKFASLTALATIACTAPVAPVFAGTIDAAEKTHMIFMREEEKLARDVYLTLGDMYPNASVFNQIAEGSEQTHTDTMLSKLVQFGIPDPNPSTNNLPGSIGVFTGADYGSYFDEKYSYLVAEGAKSELDALYVGAFIEELDMHDIVLCPSAIMKLKGLTETGCGLEYTDEKALKNTYNSLLDGSESHLRAYVGQIEAIIGVGNYVAQYLPQATVNTILGR